MVPLFQALKKKPKSLVWSDTTTTAFEQTKQALANATMLSHPHPNALITLITDASDLAVGAVLQQFVNGSWIPLAFFSQKLRPPETKYMSAFDRELLTFYLGIRYFRYFLEGRCFAAFTDHKPLTYSLLKSTEPWSARQQRQLAYISEFTTDMQHVEGKENLVVDALSTWPWPQLSKRMPKCKPTTNPVKHIFSLMISPVETKVPHRCAMCRVVRQGPLYPVAGGGKCSTWSTISHTHPAVPPGNLFLPSSFGLVYKNK